MKSVVLSLAVSLVSFSAVAHEAVIPDSGGLQEVFARDGREIIADSKELTVYTFAPDKTDISVCYDACAKEWPPVLAAEGVVVKAPFGTTTRKDGTLQITRDHRPLYNYDDDKVKGDIFGDGVGGVWFVVDPDAPIAK